MKHIVQLRQKKCFDLLYVKCRTYPLETMNVSTSWTKVMDWPKMFLLRALKLVWLKADLYSALERRRCYTVGATLLLSFRSSASREHVARVCVCVHVCVCGCVCVCVCGFRGVSICILVYLLVTVELCALITENTYLLFIINK